MNICAIVTNSNGKASSCAAQTKLLMSLHVCKCQQNNRQDSVVQAGGSGVVVNPVTYIFEEEPVRWRKLLDSLDL